MKKQFVTYEITLALKELGFNDFHRFGWYIIEDGTEFGKSLHVSGDDAFYFDTEYCIKSPLYQQVIDWLYEQYVYVSIYKECIGSDEWEFAYRIEYLPKEAWKLKRRALFFKRIDSFKDGCSSYYGAWNTSYEAREAAVLMAIELLRGNKGE